MRSFGFGLLVLTLASCGLPPIETASGRPEVWVTVPPDKAKVRIVNFMAENGYHVHRSDDLGVEMHATLGVVDSTFFGDGVRAVRFTLLPTNRGAHVRATCHFFTNNRTLPRADTTTGKMGFDIHQLLTTEFRDELDQDRLAEMEALSSRYSEPGPTKQAHPSMR